MDALPYVDTLFKEYLLFRGFTSTLDAFSKELAADPGWGFQAERITTHIFHKLIPSLDCKQLVNFLEFLNMGLYSRLDSRYEPLVTAVEADLLRMFLVTAHTAKRPDKVAEFFKLYGAQLLSSSSSNSLHGAGQQQAVDWREWFVLPYLQHPEKEEQFQVYFSQEWASLVEISFCNFLSGATRCLPLPAVLRFNTDRRLRLALQQQVQTLQSELEQTRQQLAAAVALLQQQSSPKQLNSASMQQIPGKITPADGMQQGSSITSLQQHKGQHRRGPSLGDWRQQQHQQQQQHQEPADGQQQQCLEEWQQQEQQQPQHQQAVGPPALSGPQQAAGLFQLVPFANNTNTAALVEPQKPAESLHSAMLLQQRPQQQQQQQQQQHVRVASSGGGISFDTAIALQDVPQELDDTPALDNVPQAMVAMQSQLGCIDVAAEPDSPTLSAGSSSCSSAATAATDLQAGSKLSNLPLVVSWASGIAAADRVRRHSSSKSTSKDLQPSAYAAAAALNAATTAATVSPPVPASVKVAVTQQKQHEQEGSISCMAFSPTGGNVATGSTGGTVSIWSPEGLPGSAARHATVICGASVSCIAFDTRADKLMLIGCSGGGGVRAWHLDTTRIMQDVAAESGYPHAVAVAFSPSEPAFVVAANDRLVAANTAHHSRITAASSDGSSRVHGRISLYNGRSFKRSAVLAPPEGVGVASVAYNSSGSALIVGTTAGTLLRYEPVNRSSPTHIWQVGAVSAAGREASARVLPVQVAWRPLVALGHPSAAAPVSTGPKTASRANQIIHTDQTGAVVTLSNGVLCIWSTTTSTPMGAMNVVAAAMAALESDRSAAVIALKQSGQPMTLSSTIDGTVAGAAPCVASSEQWYCEYAVSPDGSHVVVLCANDVAGVLLLYTLHRNGGSSPGPWPYSAQPQVLLQGPQLSGSGCTAWHPRLPVIVVACKNGTANLMVRLD